MNIKVLVLTLAATFSFVGLNAPVLALDGSSLYQSKACFTCHGPDAKTPILSSYPKLAGQSADYAFAQMQDIKSGARANGQTAAMKGIIAMVSDDEMKAIAVYLASLK